MSKKSSSLETFHFFVQNCSIMSGRARGRTRIVFQIQLHSKVHQSSLQKFLRSSESEIATTYSSVVRLSHKCHKSPTPGECNSILSYSAELVVQPEKGSLRPVIICQSETQPTKLLIVSHQPGDDFYPTLFGW